MDQINKTDCIKLQNADIIATFDKHTGMMRDLQYKHESLGASVDQYKLRLRDRLITAFETANRVLDYEQHDNRIIFRLENPELENFKIIQKYTLLPDRVCKKATFVPEQDCDGFFTYRCGGKLNPEFRKNSVYQTLRGWDVKTIFNADEITEPTRLGHPQANWGSKVVTVSRIDKNLVLAHYAWKQDDRYTWLITQMYGEATEYTASGWHFPAITFHPEASRTNSFKSVFQVVNGTHLDFYESYRNSNEVQERITTEHPKWLRDTKFEIICWRNPIDEYSTFLQKLLDASRYSNDENGLMTIWGWTDWGRFPSQDDDAVFTGRDGSKETITARKMSEILSSARQKNKAVKIGLYQLLWSLPPSAETDTPDWISYAPDGCPVKMNTEPGWVPIYRRLSNPDSRKSIIEGLNSLYNYFPIDFMYLDGGVRGQSYPDWKTMQCDDANKWLDLWNDIFDNIRHSHPDYALFCNNPFPIYSHAGYSENGSFGRWYNEDWRCLADIFCIVKSFQVPGRFLSVLYRSTGYRTNEPQYTNMLLAAGLTPAGSKDPDIHPELKSLPSYLPYINAAFELRDTAMVNAVIAPRYFAPEARAQCHTLKLRNTLLISALRHKGDDTEQLELLIDNQKAGLNTGEEYFLYQIDVKPANIEYDVKLPENGGLLKLKSIAKTVFLGAIQLTRPTSSFQFELPLNRLRFLALSKSCARIIKVNGRKTQFQLPALLKAAVDTQNFGDGMELIIDSPYENITVRVSLPKKLDHEPLALTPSGISFRKVDDELEIDITQNIKQIIIYKQEQK